MPDHERRPAGPSTLIHQVTAVVGRFVAASNATLLAETADGTRVVYKPIAGERPLWDFAPETLAWREVLAYEVAAALSWDVVPETVMGEGPYGPGSVQRYVEVDDDFDPVTLIQAADTRLWPMALLDVLINNADRKVGHVLGSEGRVFGVDHGLTFHTDDKLRTVLWTFSGMRAPRELLGDIEQLEARLDGELGAQVTETLGGSAFDSLRSRVRLFLDNPIHPEPPQDRPAVPWPPY
ncbi:MAG: SCO1664 family protein [Acidimicrobiia bacterium]|nr:SCO1664 family protein [Acidimicrobiia bacterium]